MRLAKTVTGTFACALLALVSTALVNAAMAGGAQKRSPRSRSQTSKASSKPKTDYTKFSHQTHVITQKLACNSCHKVPSRNWKEVRKADQAFPDVADFPEHASCLNCHRRQFFARERPAPLICSNCHVANSPRDTSRWLFPSLGDLKDPKFKRREFVSEFRVGFPHDKHLDAIGGTSAFQNPFVLALFQDKKSGPPKSCAMCHETYQPQGDSSEEYVTKPPKNIGDNFWLKKGTFKTIPNSHTTCFSCHSADSGLAPEPKDCGTCHKLLMSTQWRVDFDEAKAATMGIIDKVILARWSRRVSSGAFRHEGGEHPDLNCLNCHNVESATFNTTDPKTLRVPVRSCGGADGCHITATTDDGGILNFEIDQRKKNPAFVCTKCHVTFGKESVPDDHAAAIPTPKPKAKTN